MNERLQHYAVRATDAVNGWALLVGIVLVLASLMGNISPLPEPGKLQPSRASSACGCASSASWSSGGYLSNRSTYRQASPPCTWHSVA